MRLLFLSSPPSKDKKIDDDVTVRGDSYSIRDALALGQEKQVQFDDEHDEVHDRPILQPQYYQQKILPPPKSQRNKDDQPITKETILIKIAEGKDRF